VTPDYDLAVIGGGSGGVRAARVAASYGARVVLVESAALGGTCVNLGCIPKKILAYAAHLGDDLRSAGSFGWTVGEVGFDWATLTGNRDAEITRLNQVYAQLLDRGGVELVTGRAVIAGPHTVRVGPREITARYLLLATGGHPWRPSERELPGQAHAVTSDDVFRWPTLPRRLVVIGGGYIATEIASVMHGFGVDVEIVHRGGRLLRGFDPDLQHELANELRAKGIRLRLAAGPRGIEAVEDGLVVTLDDESVETDAVLLAVGRSPNTAGLGLADHGVALGEAGAVIVDDDYRTSIPSIFAVGDVIDRMRLTPVALAEAMVVVTNLFGPGGPRLDYRNIATAVFTSPQVGTVGLSEPEARLLGPVRIFKSSFTPLRHRISGRRERAHVKVVVDAATDRVLGLHIVSEDAAEMLQGFAVAVKLGVTKAQLDSVLGIHPTVAEELVTLRTEFVPPLDPLEEL
jgi:glutathione reductase (NADPH)